MLGRGVNFEEYYCNIKIETKWIYKRHGGGTDSVHTGVLSATTENEIINKEKELGGEHPRRQKLGSWGNKNQKNRKKKSNRHGKKVLNHPWPAIIIFFTSTDSPTRISGKFDRNTTDHHIRAATRTASWCPSKKMAYRKYKTYAELSFLQHAWSVVRSRSIPS